MDDFSSWLNEMATQNGWSGNELARRAGVTGATISNVMNERTAVTYDLCAGIAKALQVPAEDVFRRAGLLPPATGGEKIQIATDLARNLPEPLLDLWLEQGRVIYRQKNNLTDGGIVYKPTSTKHYLNEKRE